MNQLQSLQEEQIATEIINNNRTLICQCGFISEEQIMYSHFDSCELASSVVEIDQSLQDLEPQFEESIEPVEVQFNESQIQIQELTLKTGEEYVFYTKLDVKYHHIATELWIQYKCESLIDLFNAFVLHIHQLCDNRQSSQLLQFAIPRDLISWQLNRFVTDQYFYPLVNGKYISVYQYKHQTINSVQLLCDLGIKRQLLTMTLVDIYNGSVSYGLDIALRQFQFDRSINKILVSISKSVFNNQQISRSVKWLSIQEIQQLVQNDAVQIDQITHQQISANMMFFIDVDLKSKLGKITDEYRIGFMDQLYTTLQDVMYHYSGQRCDIRVIGSNQLRSCHMYTNTPVRIYDCPAIVQYLQEIMINKGYNQQDSNGNYIIRQIIDQQPYPREGKAQIRFPGSDKLELIKETDSDKSDTDDNNVNMRVMVHRSKAQVIGNIDFYILQPLHIRNLEIQPSLLFNNNTPWQIQQYSLDQDDESISDCEQSIQNIVDKHDLKHQRNNRYTYDGICPVCVYQHKSEGNRLLYINNIDDGKIKITCVRSRRSKVIKQSSSNNQYQQNILYELKRQFDVTQYSKQVQFDVLKSHMTFCKSAVGTGKTYQIQRAINKFEQQYNRSAKVLFISVRVSFSHSIVQQMKTKYGIAFDLYDDNDIDIRKSDKLMIQVESVPRVIDIDRYDFVIIDEANSVLKQAHNVIANNIKIFTCMQKHIINASHVVVCDSLLTDHTVQAFRQLGCKSEQLIYNSYQPYADIQCGFNYCINVKQCDERYLQAIHIHIQQGHRIFSYFDERERMIQMHQLLISNKIYNESDILIIHGDNLKTVLDDDDNKLKHHILQKRQIYKQGDYRLDKYKLVMITSSLTVGIDSQIQGFHGVHMLYKCDRALCSDIYQSVHRLRQIQSQTFIYTSTKQFKQHMPITPRQYFTSIFGDRLLDTHTSKYTDQTLLQILAIYEIQQNYQKQRPIQLLQAFMQELGYDIVFDNINLQQEITYYTTSKCKTQFIPYSIDDLQVLGKLYRNGNNAITEDDICENLSQKVVTYRSVMQYYIKRGIYEPNEQQLLDIDIQQKAYKQRDMNTQQHLARMVNASKFTEDIQESGYITKQLSAITKSVISGQQLQVRDLNDTQKQRINLCKILFLAFSKKDGQCFAHNHIVDTKFKHLLDIDDCYKLAVQIMTMCNIEINHRTVPEMIKTCGFQLKNKRVTVDGKRQRQYQLEQIVE